jgi:hypothetical protein
MRELTETRARRRDQIIASAMVDVATELRLTDPTELIHLIRGEQAANIADLVNSSGELFFRSGTLRYALTAGCSLQWDSTPVVRLDMEFHYAAVSAFFKLTIGRKRAGVEVIDVLVDSDDELDDAIKDDRLRDAVASARLPPRKPGASPVG